MDFKKIMHILLVLVMIGALIGVQTAYAATSRVALCRDFGGEKYEVDEFFANNNDYCLEIYARLYVDGEWRAWRELDFDIYDPQGNPIKHCIRLTGLFNGYTGIGIFNEDLSKWKTGEYTVKVSYSGNEGKEWPAASNTAVIHYQYYG